MFVFENEPNVHPFPESFQERINGFEEFRIVMVDGPSHRAVSKITLNASRDALGYDCLRFSVDGGLVGRAGTTTDPSHLT